MKKRILAFFVCVVMAFSCSGVGFAADATQTDISGEAAVVSELLKEIGIFEGYGGDYFTLDRELTKAEMCGIIAQVINMGFVCDEMYDGVAVFSDVPSSHWAASEIALMKDLKVISGNGDSSFFPENKVTPNEAVKMIVSALGYDAIALSRGGYPAGYISIASEAGILSGVNMQEKVTYADVVLMIYNSFDTPIVRAISVGGNIEYSFDADNYDTILSIRDIDYDEGQITANEYSSFVPGYGACAENAVVINDNVYRVGQTDISDKLGHNVEFYFKKNDEKNEIVTYYVADDKSLTLNAVDVLKADLKGIEYENASGAVKSANISQGAVFIYNGTATDASNKLFDIKSGSLTLVDSGVSGKASGYDIIIIDSRSHFMIESITSDDIIYLENAKFEDKASIDISEAVITKDGKLAESSDILQGNVVSVAKSADGLKLMIEVVSGDVFGEVKEFDSDNKIVIGSAQYNISKEFSSYKNEVVEPGKTGTFYLDKFGDVFYFKSGEEDVKYAFCFGVKSDAMGESVQVRLLLGDSTYQNFEIAKNVEVANADGVLGKTISVSKDSAESYFKSTLTDVVFVYDTNSKNEINYIELPADGDIVNNIAGITLDYVLNFEVKYGYSRIGEGYIHLNSDTKGFVICKSGDGYDEKNSYVKSSGRFSDNGSYGSESNPIYFYDVNEMGIVGAFLDYTNAKAGSFTVKELPVVLVDSVVQSLTDEGDDARVLKGIMGNTESKWVINDEPYKSGGLKSIDNIKRGDVLLMNRNLAGEISGYSVIYDSENPTMGKLFVAGNGYGAVSATDTTVYGGYIYRLDSKNIRLCWNGSSFITFSLSSNCSVYVHDSKKDDVYIGDMKDIAYSDLNEYTNNSKVILRANRNTVDTLIICK